MQGSAEWSDGDRAALRGRLDTLSLARAELQRSYGFRERGLALLRLGGPVRHAGPGQERADRDGQFVRFAARIGERQVGCDARAVSAGLLREGHGRTDRRSEG